MKSVSNKSRPRTIDLIIVCYNSLLPLQETLKFLSDAPRTSPSLSITVVNNSVDDAAPIMETGTRYGAKVIQMQRNVGFGSAANRGAFASSADYLLFISPGLLISGASIDALVDAAKSSDDAVAWSPLMSSATGRTSYKTRALSSGFFRRARLNGFGATPPLIQTGFVSGGSFMVRRDSFLSVGGFDERIFLFHEDDDLSLRLGRLGSMFYVTASRCVHPRNPHSRSDAMVRQLRGWHLGHSNLFVRRKHHGSLGTVSAVLFCLMSVASPVYLFSGSRRTKVNAMLRGTWAEFRGVPASDFPPSARSSGTSQTP